VHAADVPISVRGFFAGWFESEKTDGDGYRLTVFLENRRFHLVVDEQGNAIQCSTGGFGRCLLLASVRRPAQRQEDPTL
jgi:hypothetical protein